MESILLLAFQRIAANEASAEDQAMVGRALAQSGGIHFGQGNQISIAGNVIGSLELGDLSQEQFLAILQRLFPMDYQPVKWDTFDRLADLGDLPPGSRMPFNRNHIFTGREAILMILGNTLLAGGKHAVVSGTGGMGKTQLAVEFCFRYGRFFSGVHWVQASLDIDMEIAGSGTVMSLHPWPDKLPDQVAMTLEAWGRGTPRLVIFDNVEEIQRVQDWLPRLNNVRLLLTSRQRDWPPDLGFEHLPMDSLLRGESLQLLRKLAPRLEKVPDDELESVAEQLGDLPLALDLAGRYLSDRKKLEISGFLLELEQAGSTLMHSALVDWTRHNPTRHETNLAATFLLGWEKLEIKQAKHLFFGCGYCAARTPIPWDLLYLFAKANENRGQASVDKDLATLEEMGLVNLTEMGLIIHPLLAEFAQLQDQYADESALAEMVEAVEIAAKQANQSGQLEPIVPIFPHAAQTAIWAGNKKLEKAGQLWNLLAIQLVKLAAFSQAKAAFEYAYILEVDFFGSEHPNVARILSGLGEMLRVEGN